jgi:hypothetical protein
MKKKSILGGIINRAKFKYKRNIGIFKKKLIVDQLVMNTCIFQIQQRENGSETELKNQKII